jgi:hypothetical protein
MTDVEVYQITSEVQPASVIHVKNPIHKPGTTTDLSADATFFEPTESYGEDGVPRFSQLVINGQLTGETPNIKVSEYYEYFVVTDPGEMGTQGFYAQANDSGAAVLTPAATSQPKTYRKKGLVQVYLTTSNNADAEAAYNDGDVDWCAISFATFFTDLQDEKASVSASYRTFNKYLKGSTATNSVFTDITNTEYRAAAYSTGTGDTSYVTTGLYRSKVVPFLRKPDGTQLYLKTNVTF